MTCPPPTISLHLPQRSANCHHRTAPGGRRLPKKNRKAADTWDELVAIAKFAQEHEVKYTAMAAGSTLSLIPALLLLLLGQRFIVRGLVAGAFK